MTTTNTLHPLAADYLDKLDRAARRLPRGERLDLAEEISAHLAEATDPDMSDAEILTVLDRLGDPEDIVNAERAEEPPRPEGPRFQEWAAILLLLFGGFIVLVGWIAGAVLLWGSRAWNLRDKLIGTLIVPGGLATAFAVLLVSSTPTRCVSFQGGPEHCPGGASTLHDVVAVALFAVCLLGPICTSAYLARRGR